MSRPDRGGPLARWLPPLAIIVALLAVWEIAVRVAKVPDWLLPPPSAVAATLVRERDLLLANARVTLAEVLLGFAAAVVAGVLIAVLIDASPAVNRAVYPLVVEVEFPRPRHRSIVASPAFSALRASVLDALGVLDPALP